MEAKRTEFRNVFWIGTHKMVSSHMNSNFYFGIIKTLTGTFFFQIFTTHKNDTSHTWHIVNRFFFRFFFFRGTIFKIWKILINQSINERRGQKNGQLMGNTRDLLSLILDFFQWYNLFQTKIKFANITHARKFQN